MIKNRFTTGRDSALRTLANVLNEYQKHARRERDDDEWGLEQDSDAPLFDEKDSVVRKSPDTSKAWLVVLLLIPLFFIVFIFENANKTQLVTNSDNDTKNKPVTRQANPPPTKILPLSNQLYNAVSQNNLEKAKQLVMQLSPGEINSVVGGMTAVMKASSIGNVPMVELLIAHGADPNRRGSQQRTALQYAAERNRLAVAKILLKHGADINGTDTSRLSPLTMAADRGYHDFAMFLIEKGADVNIQHVQGWTALIDAARNGDLELVKRLVDAGADINLRAKSGGSALDFARKHNHNNVEAYLLKQYENN